MSTQNKRVSTPQANTINGIDAGGMMTAQIYQGYDQLNESAPDGLQVSETDRECQYTRGSVVSQDWVHAVELLTGAVDSLVFYERKSGAAAATGYIKHTIALPVIHKMTLQFNRKNYATVGYLFECRAADENAGFLDMFKSTDDQAAPTYISSLRGGVRIESATHGTGGTILNILHNTDFEFSIELPLKKESNDSDVGYTCVDAMLDGMVCMGKIGFQDSSVKAATTQRLAQQLLAALKGPLALQVRQSQGAISKVVTIAGAEFQQYYSDSGAEKDFTGFFADYKVSNSSSTQLTLDGANKIITIEAAA